MYKQYVLNGKLISFYLFQYSLLMFLMNYIEPSYIIAISSSVIFLFSIIINKRKINISFILLLFTILMVFIFLLKITFQPGNSYKIFFYFFTICAPGLFLIGLKFDKNSFLLLSNKLSILNFFLNFGIPFISNNFDYMRFGYGLVPTIVFLYLYLVENKRGKLSLLYKTIFILAFIELLIFGCRGSLFTVIIFIIIHKILLQKEKVKTFFSFLFIGLSFNYIRLFFISLTSYIIDYHGIDSYILFKIRMMLTGRILESSSGRYELYCEAIKNIYKHPFIGNHLCKPIMGQPFVHNIYLQIANDLGVIALGIFIVFLLVCVYYLISKKIVIEDKIILNIFMTTTIGRLTFSSTLWRRPEFWLFVGFALIMITKNNRINSFYYK